MAEPTYHLVFRGEVLEDQQPAEVCRRLAALLKMSPEKAKQLFSGRQVVLKRDVPKAVAARYQTAFRKAGARLRVLPAESEAKPAGPAASQPSGDAAPARKPSLAERLAAEDAGGNEAGGDRADSRSSGSNAAAAPVAAAAYPAAASVPDDAPGANAFSVAPQGGDLVSAEELRRPPPPPPDTSMLSLDEPGVDLTEVHEVEPLELDLSALSLAEPGAEVGQAQRPPPPPAPDPDFSLAEPGADLGPGEKAPAPPPPDTEHLQIERERASFRPPDS